MPLMRAIAVLFLVLGFALGSVIGVAAVTEQAFAEPCPMHDQGGDCPCCKGDCSGAMMGCSAKCSPSVGVVALLSLTSIVPLNSASLIGLGSDVYDPFLTGPPPPIPIV